MTFLYELLVNCAFAVTIAMVWWVHDPRPLAYAGLGAAFGFFAFQAALYTIGGIFFPTMLSATAIGCSAEIFSKKAKTPALVLLAPGLYTLVPGSRMYEGMLAFVQKDYGLSLSKFGEVALISGGIAIGVLVASMLFLSVRRMRKAGEKFGF